MAVCRNCDRAIVSVPVRLLDPVEMWVHADTNAELCHLTYAEPKGFDSTAKR